MEHPDSKYARPELERRFLLGSVPEGCLAPRHIADHYLDGTRLRLRRVESDTGRIEYKLGQKVRPEPSDPSVVWMTNIYLSADEYDAVRRLPGARLDKTRYTLPGSPPLAVDVFLDGLTGLVLAEVSFPSRDAMARFAAPAMSLADVSRDDRFSGGRLARTTRAGLETLLQSMIAG